MNNTGKIKFKKDSEKPKLRDSVIFIMIIVLCVVTVVTIQLKSQQRRETDTLNSQRVERNIETAPVSTEPTENREEPAEQAKEPDISDSLALQRAAAKARKESSPEESAEIAKSEDIPADTAEEAFSQEVKQFEFSVPVAGKILKEYTSSELLYSKTLDDWRMHLGVDISAPIGASVSACEDGTVEEISDDEEYGTTVTLRHNERIVTRYSNLAGKLDVSIGDKVTKGQKIGVVGDTAMYEILDEPHLHFSMSDNGAMVNPDKYIKFE
ncbi:MAG: M23 family metallopeptidase [Clostridia bacterium]|nr:M23 family metallopeptidase [Clostridia bacterium]